MASKVRGSGPRRPAQSQQGQQKCPATSKPAYKWELGDIAFLKRAEEFSQDEREKYLQTGRIFSKATCHPVIVLGRSEDSKYYIVTTVSAYSDDAKGENPPWRQKQHQQRKKIDGFRAFKGSCRPNPHYKFLELADGKEWPKPKTSWVYIHLPMLVPASTLIQFTKAKGQQLRMATESLGDLLSHMDAKADEFKRAKREMQRVTAPINQGPPAQQNRAQKSKQ
ncbi:hypothetical protein F4777DRAFT_580898 [Nemania sp. FL0916]|nr:hypothetical protein F4777DRAFT_580898 [Nemania sp. FL0916]